MGNITVNELKVELIKLTFDVQVDVTPKGDTKPAAHEWRLTLPGEIGDHNAESIEGQTLIWKIEPGEVATLHAESSMRINPLIWAMIGLALLLGVVSILLLRRRS